MVLLLCIYLRPKYIVFFVTFFIDLACPWMLFFISHLPDHKVTITDSRTVARLLNLFKSYYQGSRQSLEGYFWDPGLDQSTVRDSVRRKIS